MTTTAHIDDARASVVAEEDSPHAAERALWRAVIALEAEGWQVLRTSQPIRNGRLWLRQAWLTRAAGQGAAA